MNRFQKITITMALIITIIIAAKVLNPVPSVDDTILWVVENDQKFMELKRQYIKIQLDSCDKETMRYLEVAELQLGYCIEIVEERYPEN